MEGTRIGPLIDKEAQNAMASALTQARSEGGTVHGGAPVLGGDFPNGAYVMPAVVEMPEQISIMHTETFAPILYAVKYHDIDEAIRLQNAVPQGLSSCIFSTDVRETELFLFATGSDCGIANVNIGPSGAEIGGALVGKRKPAAAGRADRTLGRRTCAARPTRSTTQETCHSLRAFSLISKPCL